MKRAQVAPLCDMYHIVCDLQTLSCGTHDYMLCELFFTVFALKG